MGYDVVETAPPRADSALAHDVRGQLLLAYANARGSLAEASGDVATARSVYADSLSRLAPEGFGADRLDLERAAGRMRLNPARITRRMTSGDSTAWAPSDRSLPDFALRDLDGRTWHNADFAGHPTLVVFWTSWCGACIAQLPLLDRMRERIGLPARIVTILADAQIASARAVVARYKIALPVLLGNYSLYQQWTHAPGMGYAWLVDGAGRVRYVANGLLPEDIDSTVSLLAQLGR